MKFVKIQPCAKPVDFSKVKFTQKEWETAERHGAVTVPYVTAIEAVRNSGGLYQIAPEAKQEVEVKVGGLSLAQMDASQLKMMAVHLGVTIRKKSIRRTELESLVRAKLDYVEVIEDVEVEIEEPDESPE